MITETHKGRQVWKIQNMGKNADLQNLKGASEVTSILLYGKHY